MRYVPGWSDSDELFSILFTGPESTRIYFHCSESAYDLMGKIESSPSKSDQILFREIASNVDSLRSSFGSMSELLPSHSSHVFVRVQFSAPEIRVLAALANHAPKSGRQAVAIEDEIIAQEFTRILNEIDNASPE